MQHSEHVSGVGLGRIEKYEHVGALGAFRILLVRPDDDSFTRRRAERVSRRAIREPVREGGYDAPTFFADDPYSIVPELQSHAVLIADGSCGVGLAVFERRQREIWYEWSESAEVYQLTSTSGAGVAWSIVHVWLLGSLRGRGLGVELLRICFEGFATEPSSGGWYTPFSQNGGRLVRRFAPSGFWYAGDAPLLLEDLPRPF